MNVQIDSVMKRARGYWFIDGFTEMAAGGLFIILAAVFLLRWNTPQTSFSIWFMSVAGEISLVKFLSLLVLALLLWWLKDRFTYPRTGFVRGNRVTAAQIFILLRNVILPLLLPLFGLLAASLLIASAGKVLSSMPVWFPVGVSLIWAILFVLGGEWMGVRRFRLLGGMILLTGLVIGFWQFSMGVPVSPLNIQPDISQPAMLQIINRAFAGLGFLILVTGVILLFSGFITFLRYRKENPTPYTEDV